MAGGGRGVVTMVPGLSSLWWCLLIWPICTITAASQENHNSHTGMWPDRQLVASDSTLELNCTLPEDNTGIRRANDIYFQFNSKSYPPTFIVDVHTATLRVQSVGRNLTGNWSCLLHGRPPTTIGQQTVTVADLPTKPNITGCIVYNWESMTCTWEPKVQDTGIPTNQSLYWTVLLPHIYSCPHAYANTCTWKRFDSGDSLKFEDYALYVEAKNDLDTTISAIKYYNARNIGKTYLNVPIKWEMSVCGAVEWTSRATFCDSDSPTRWLWMPRTYGHCGIRLCPLQYSSHRGRRPYKCPNPSILNASCTWLSTGGPDSLKNEFPYSVVVTSNNSIGMVHSGVLHLNTGHIVMPNPVGNLAVMETGQNHVVLSWNAPFKNKAIRYKVYYNGGLGETNVTSKSELLTENITGLEPFTEYNFTISCIPWHGDTDRAVGFWSESRYTLIRTNESVPSTAPGIFPGGFRTSDAQGNNHSVDIYWQLVKKAAGHDEALGYQVRYLDVSEGKWQEPINVARVSTVRLSLAKDRAYQVVVDAKTNAGFNPDLNLTPLYIEKEANMPLKVTKVVSQNWPNASLVLMFWSPIVGASRYTMYWCRGSVQVWTCEGELNLAVVPENTTSWNVSLANNQYKRFLFGVSAEFQRKFNMTTPGTDLVSSGLVWSQCTHPGDKSVSPPLEVKFLANQKAESITVEWTNPRCEDTVYIDKYIIYYCPVTECAEGDEDVSQLHVDSDQDVATIENLKPTVEYRVWMKSWSRYKGKSIPTEKQATRVHASGLSKGAIAGIAIVGVVIALLIMYGIYQSIKYSKKKFKEKTNIGFEAPPDVSHFPDNKYDDPDMQNYQTLLYGHHEQEMTSASEQDQVYLENGSSGDTIRYGNGALPPSDTLQTLLQHDGSDSGHGLSHDGSESGHGLSGPDSGRCAEPLSPVPEESGADQGWSPSKSGGVVPSSSREVCNTGRHSSAYTIPGYSKCRMPDEEDGEEAQKMDDQDVVGSSGKGCVAAVPEPTPPTSSLPPDKHDMPQPVPSADTQSRPAGMINGTTEIGLVVGQPEVCSDTKSNDVVSPRTDATKAPSLLEQRTVQPNGCLVGNGISPIQLDDIVQQQTSPVKSVNFKNNKNAQIYSSV